MKLKMLQRRTIVINAKYFIFDVGISTGFEPTTSYRHELNYALGMHRSRAFGLLITS